MYIYQIRNKINNKLYIGQTNDIAKRWGCHRSLNSPKLTITKAMKKYGVENFEFTVLYRNVPLDEIDELEINTIEEKGSLVPNGYNVAIGGRVNRGVRKYGADNSNAHLTKEEAQYILDNRDKPMYVLYEQFSDKITYNQFKKVYRNEVYTNLSTEVKMYPFNAEFTNQFSDKGLEYNEVIDIRKRYANGEYWKDVYPLYKHIYSNELSFWRAYNGLTYKYVMPEVFTEENKKRHSSICRSGSRNGRAKLSKEDVLLIRKMHKEGARNSEIYEKYSQVSTATIRDIINGKTWKNLL